MLKRFDDGDGAEGARGRFVFGVPLIARAATPHWASVEALLADTLRSVLAQTTADWTLLLATHDEPDAWRRRVGADPRCRLLRADWTPEPPSPANDDGGRKKAMIKAAVRGMGGGLLMFLDADDWVDRDLVRVARASIGPAAVGGVVANGWARDCATGRAMRFPLAGAFDGRFHELCGSSVVARVDPASADPFAQDPHRMMGQHGDWLRSAAAHGRELALLGVEGVYTIGASESHSERHGPYAAWRRALTETVRERGRTLTADELARFGLAERNGSTTADEARFAPAFA